MHKIKVPIRRVESYVADDQQRKIDVLTRTGFVETEVDDSIDPNTIQFAEEEVIYIGIMPISHPNGSLDVKFRIDASSIVEAFEKYIDHAQDAHKKVMTQILNQQQAVRTATPEEEEIIKSKEASIKSKSNHGIIV